MSDIMKNHYKNLIFILLLFIVFGIFYFARGEHQAAAFELDDNFFLLHGPEDFSVTIDLNDLQSIETRNGFSPGTCISGGEVDGYSYGIWENQEFGQYHLCILSNVSTCVVMTETDGNVTVLNFENDQTTEEFGRSFPEYLREHGYL